MAETVVLKKCVSYDLSEMEKQISSGLELLGGLDNFVKKDEKVLLKVNCLFPSDPEKAVITHPLFLQAVVRIIKTRTKNIMIGDSPGFGNFMTNPKTGYRKVAEEEGVELVDFKEDADINNPQAVSYKNFKVASYAVTVDKIINLPKLKTHGLMYMTLAVKNMFGIVVGTGKPGYHLRAGRDKMLFAQMLVDLFMARQPVLNIMDGITAMEGNGPGGGDPVNTGVIIMSGNGFALDHVAPQVVGIDPGRVYTNAAYRKNVLKGREIEVEIKGEKLADVRYKGSFTPVPDSDETGEKKSFIMGWLSNAAKRILTPRQIYLKERCTGCLSCVKACPVNVLEYDKIGKKINCDYDKCIRCFICQEICPEKAIVIKKPFFSGLFK
jgi:uncharacterized protein (DUF362 family)/Pyruvate/2-oxoacid:ferredoxin oxidoreductase delta subunit